jgi:hypothetical protein
LASVPAPRRRCFHSTSRRLTVEGEGEGLQSVADASFWNEYKASRMFFSVQNPSLTWRHNSRFYPRVQS